MQIRTPAGPAVIDLDAIRCRLALREGATNGLIVRAVLERAGYVYRREGPDRYQLVASPAGPSTALEVWAQLVRRAQLLADAYQHSDEDELAALGRAQLEAMIAQGLDPRWREADLRDPATWPPLPEEEPAQ